MKKIALLGSTGSIGTSTLRIVEHLPESFSIAALAAHGNITLLSKQIEQFKPELVAVFDQSKASELKSRFPHQKIVSGEEGVLEAAAYPSADFVVMAIVGTRALQPTVCALEAGKPVGLASKEVMVAAGELIGRLARERGVPILPIDSEHSAIFQCLEGRKLSEVRRLILTASGGPFLRATQDQLASVTVEEALAHPTWSMGPKVTIDSSTLINKGLEKIEARWLFDIPPEKIEVVIHPQSIVHSFVEFIDGSILAQMSEPDMVYPIQYALTYPERKKGMFPAFDFVKNGTLQFFSPDYQKFPALSLVHESLRIGGSSPCYLNAANEVLVARFLKKEIAWLDIMQKLEKLLGRHRATRPDTIEAILKVDEEARREAFSI
ncbi:MAG: 1-deoxy-D-xylulose-5-phosphate reductoisomerase [Chlamydiales bacterium]|nr:1-deoxy-D-xylulose-5-phosphate reductoisomerase [Chlamydiales bacterium]